MRRAKCASAWEEFLLEHPACDERTVHPAGTAGLAAYATAPYLAWSGWRLRVPGGPVGGQYHGFIAPDETQTGVGWPAGDAEMIRPMDNPAGLGAFPWESWDEQWGGIPLHEGETVSDYVYRGPAEIRPRPNASGGVNTVRAVQSQRSAGYAIAPGNYKGIGAATDLPMIRNLLSMPRRVTAPVSNVVPYRPGPLPGRPPVCPAWGCGAPPIWHTGPSPEPFTPPNPAPAPAPVVTQPPPPSTPSPAPTVGAGGCPGGQYRDAAGNCTADWSHPYPLYLPDTSSPAPAPTVSANTCPTGYSLDGNGNCVPAGSAPSGEGIMGWLEASTSIAGVNIPNFVLAGAGALLAFKMLGGKR